MLQTNLGGTPIEMTVFNPSDTRSKGNEPEPIAAPCEVTEQLLNLFEQVTGWKVEFAESRSSQFRRQLPGSAGDPAEGTFSIVDMSADWPAKKPTCHRQKCDQLVALIDQLVGQRQSSQTELIKLQSALACDPGTDVDEEQLVDSFVPKFGRRASDRVALIEGDSFIVAQPVSPEAETDFDLHQPVSEEESLVSPPFEGWTLGGATGIAGDYYLDWMVDSEEQILICTGEIDSEPGADLEAKILVDPLTNEYRVNANSEIEGDFDNAIRSFFLWDSATSALSSIEPSPVWQQLKSSQAIVATTAPKLVEMDVLNHVGDGIDAADQLANAFREVLSTNDPLLVLKRS